MSPTETFDQATWEAHARRTSRRRVARNVLTLSAVALVLLYGVRVGWLFMMADEGDTPPLSSIPIPANAQVIAQSESCGSGGCSTTFTIRPPVGQTPEQLAEEMGATPQLAVPGNAWDPRTIWVFARPSAGTLKLVTDYTSSEWVP
ncbi:MAG: hypothetical protein IJG47_08285 [Microbacterium sp.]|nr:hypothetical protein [Microbacterium sp.]